MFSREELFEYFSDKYTPTQIIAALHKLAESDKELNPEAEEFHTSITERLDQVIRIVEDAFNAQKQLGEGSPQPLANVQKMAIDMAAKQAVHLPNRVFESLVEILVGEAIANAQMLAQIQESALKQALAQKSQESLENLGQDAATRIQLAMRLVNDPEKLDRILEEFGVQPIAETETQMQVLTNTCTIDFDPDAFLEEVAGGKKLEEIPEEKRARKPQTLADTKAMVKALVSRSLH
ncbi:hypothetical protein [Iningainema tapete]|uniref:Uncharacterized protein n=1 Tax=Iningainema tapete BLCC-T55 TaxID=2748662 RepID=A0A8J6XI38_9CYAN|nr:hypothetical protein [Iningainema tapete]MBD2771126.1 hypothetical protein [Iningainema tapete BLCC-T55]